MEIIVHTSQMTGFGQRLKDAVLKMVSCTKVTCTKDIEALTKGLLKFREANPIVLIGISSIEELAYLISLKELLDGLFLIIVTDQAEPELVQKCRLFYPRLLLTNEKDYQLIKTIIRKRECTDSL